MRLFVAIELTDDARIAIIAEQQRVSDLPGGAAALRFVKPEHMHLTLAFIGDTTEDRAAAIGAAIRGDVPAAPFQMTFGGLGVFPPRGAPKVLWLGVVAGEPSAVQLHEVVVARLAAVGVVPERRTFRPHLTIARWREGPSQTGRLTAADVRTEQRARQGEVVASVEVRAVTLFHSRLSPSGPTHIELARGHLRAGDTGSLH